MQTDAMRFAHGQLPGALELAFVGDSVYDLYVRSRLVSAAAGTCARCIWRQCDM